jgi:hypothetical protein
MYLPIDRLEDALVVVAGLGVQDAGSPATVVPGRNSGTKGLPVVICSADPDGQFDPPRSGNGYVNVTVQCKSKAVTNPRGTETAEEPEPTPEEKSKALARAVWNRLLVDELPELLTAAVEDLTVFPNGVLWGMPRRFEDEEGLWVDEVQGRVYCCGRGGISD